MARSSGLFLAGILAGFSLAMPLLLLFEPPAWLALLQQLRHSAERNLQGSVPLFILVLAAYMVQLASLQSELRKPLPQLQEVARREQLLDLCSSLFFGVGVIWTAIGMRGALLFALGDPGQAAAGGAMEVLERLVEGGILLALSTTIVGGMGGYLMRAAKFVLLGKELADVYWRASKAPFEEQLNSLRRIEQRLQVMTPDPSQSGDEG